MNLDEQVVNAIFKELFEDNSERYRQSLSKPVNNDTDTYGKARNALANLSQAEKECIFKFIDLAIADSASVILGTLDGSHYPDNIDGDFIVTYKDDEIQGSLQDIFIEKAESKGIYN
ncbi:MULTISPECIES: hypothetical protein [Pantoea]|uniref:Uncharacterized protein n=1 Tax=Pantoea dispersa TaxID=59814 RepID=A0A8E1RTP9_9GAMM|nr:MULTISPECIES: hypothetical protein [Pantoea]KTR90860.1 hypothetical protein SA2_09465 [Pantoea dispersa]KTS22076.1 hypothetical protein SA4R_11325 [Pantoea dispersa]KTS52962.1 hypothetical protein SA5R_22480 [Pantoea dispersa]KTS64317.1 hypothetical protein SA3R_22455 [Pantoea dispersa]MBS0907475.1 hypothetical protein [Pantoea dispersa]